MTSRLKFFVRHQDRAHLAKIVASINYFVHVRHATRGIDDLVFAVGTRHDIVSGDLHMRDGLVCRGLPGRPYVRLNNDDTRPLFLLLVRIIS